MMSAARAAMARMMHDGWPDIWDGNTEASMMRKPLTPYTRNSGSTTPSSAVAPIFAVPTYYHQERGGRKEERKKHQTQVKKF